MKTLYFIIFSLLILNTVSVKTASAQNVVMLQQGKSTNIRGLSIVNDKIAWASGSKGYVAITVDSGKTWNWQPVKGFEQSDFRAIEAFSDKEATIMSSGTPALILKTVDAGLSWQVKYKNTDTSYFLDAMAFSDIRNGFVLGDPINSRFLLLKTNDMGNNWNNTKYGPDAMQGEAAFAASGTCLRLEDNSVYIATGGSCANVFVSSQKSISWHKFPLPIIKGKSSRGAFSIAKHADKLIIVGGDYQRDKSTDSTACYSYDNGKTWHLSHTSLSGYQSCVEYIYADTFLSTGTAGTNITSDNGTTWHQIDTASFNVCKKAKHGKLVLLAGSNGKIAFFKL